MEGRSAPVSVTDLFSVVALIFSVGHVLAVSRKNNHEDLGLPGGKIEPGETPEEAIRRELLEETGLKIGAMYPIFDHLDRVEGDERRPCRCFVVWIYEGVAKSNEGARVVWVPPSRLVEPSCMFRDYNRALFLAINVPVE